MTDDVRAQLDGLVTGLVDALGENLVGVYLHGSLVLGCFNPQRSDVDVVVLIRRPTSGAERRALVPVLLRSSGSKAWPRTPPYPLEIDVVAEPDVNPWRYPTRFDVHWSESHRRAELEAGRLMPPGDSVDLAAHVTIVRQAGLALYGPPPADVFPEVPFEDYRDSLLRDLEWCREQDRKFYSVQSASRIWATLTEGGLQSKATGAAWALERAPARFRQLIEGALALYRAETDDWDFDPDEANAYVDYVTAALRSRAAS